MIPDDVRISNFNLDTLIIPDVAETHAVPLCDERTKKKPVKTRNQHPVSVELASEKPQSHLVSCRAQVIFLQGLFGVLKGLKRELLLPPGLDVG